MTDDESDQIEQDEALDRIESSSGQQYILADEAFRLLAPFAEEVDTRWVARQNDLDSDHDDLADPTMANLGFSEGVADVQRPSRDARGLTATLPHRTILTYADVSTILVEAVGGTPSDYHAAGGGFTEDGRHEENIEKLQSLLDEQ